MKLVQRLARLGELLLRWPHRPRWALHGNGAEGGKGGRQSARQRGQVHPRPQPARLEATRYGPMAVLAVEDTGPGVPPADRERIFERFTQLDSGATRRAGGVGLGLHIARQLANAQDGELVVGDPVLGGPGARFELRLPLTPIAQDPSRTPTR